MLRTKLFKISQKKVKGFTLPDLLVAMLITGILLSLVIPNNNKLITKAKSLEAKGQLQSLHMNQEMFFNENSRYASSISETDYTPSKTVVEGGSAVYKIEIVEGGTNTYTARATATKDFDGDGIYDVWEINQDRKLTHTTPD